MANTARINTRSITGLAVLTAIVVVLQVLAATIPIGIFQLTLVLVPIVVGSALYGWIAGAWLGFVFGVVVLLTNAGVFLAVNIPGTILTCLCKGMITGALSGFVYKLLSRINDIVATVAAAVLAPVCNTGVFLVGCLLFFAPTVKSWGYENVWVYFTSALILNFLIEVAVNIVLSPTIVRIVHIRHKRIHTSMK